MSPVPRALVAAPDLAPGERVYVTQAWSHGGLRGPAVVTLWISSERLRAFTERMFRAEFSSPASFVWSESGRGAEAWDNTGNRLRVQQINDR